MSTFLYMVKLHVYNDDCVSSLIQKGLFDMLNHMLDKINIAQLEILGVQKDYLYVSVLVVCIIVILFICYAFISLCMHYQWKHAIMYILYSLGCLFLLWHPSMPDLIEIPMDVALKGIAIIGWCFALYLYVFHIVQKQRKKKGV